MPNLSVKDVPESWAEALRQRAARNHRSLQGELMAILERALDDPAVPAAPVNEATAMPTKVQGHRSVRRGWKSVEQIAAELRARFPDPVSDAPLAVDIIRADRDSR